LQWPIFNDNYFLDMEKLKGKKVAILVANGFEQSEYVKPLEALKNAGAEVHTVSPEEGKVKGWNQDNWGKEFSVDKKLNEVKAEQYDALVLPGGQMNPDNLRMEDKAVQLVKDFSSQKKPIAAICHGPWLLVEADIVEGRTITSWPSVKTDLINAGAIWKDQEVVEDSGIITSRNPDDLPAFCQKIIEVFSQDQESKKQQSANKMNA
jgi:protease I